MASGRPDWFGTIVAAGKYDDTYIPIALDADGFITATMKGLYDAVLKTIAVDADGVMKANISVQDLDELIVRVKYGTAKQVSLVKDCGASATTTIVTINAKGTVYWGHIYLNEDETHEDDLISIWVDDTRISNMAASAALYRNLTSPYSHSTYLLVRDEYTYKYAFGIGPHITFESKLEIKYENITASAITTLGELIYATI